MEKSDPEENETPYAGIGARLVWIRNFFTPNKHSFAKMMGCDQSAWLKYETGKREIPMRLAIQVANKNRVTLDFIYRGRAEGLPEIWLQRLLADPSSSDLLAPTDKGPHKDT